MKKISEIIAAAIVVSLLWLILLLFTIPAAIWAMSLSKIKTINKGDKPMKKFDVFMTSLILCILLAFIVVTLKSWEQKAIRALKTGAAMVTTPQMYGIYADDWQQLYQKCQKISVKDKQFAVVVSLNYVAPSSELKNIVFEMGIKTCEDLPRRSVCLDQDNCFIKYRSESR